jgi:hypothetical protein
LDVFGKGKTGALHVRLWGEALAEDLCTSLDRRDFREIVLGHAGVRKLRDVFVRFRGREPTIEDLTGRDRRSEHCRRGF